MKKTVLFLSIILTSCFPARVLKYNVADIKDPKKFGSVPVANDKNNIFKFASPATKKFNPPSYLEVENVTAFDRFLDKGKTVAFMVIRDDTILYENYFDKYEETTPIPSFSVSKSFVSTLIGIAVEEGHIKSIDDPITDYLPQLEDEGLKKVTIKHVLDMRAGFKFGENYFNPFSEVAKYYYGRDIRKFITTLKAKNEPGQEFKYQSVNTQVLALILESATKKTVAQYLEEKIWKPIQMEQPASWSTDDKGTVKAFCCINAIARDFAKLGRLYLKDGNWNGIQIVPKAWVDKTLYFDEPLNDFRYSNHWWHSTQKIDYSDTLNLDDFDTPYLIKSDEDGNKELVIYPSGDSFARGVLGQHIYVNPEKNIIIIRLGKGFGMTNWTKLLKAIAQEN